MAARSSFHLRAMAVVLTLALAATALPAEARSLHNRIARSSEKIRLPILPADALHDACGKWYTLGLSEGNPCLNVTIRSEGKDTICITWYDGNEHCLDKFDNTHWMTKRLGAVVAVYRSNNIITLMDGPFGTIFVKKPPPDEKEITSVVTELRKYMYVFMDLKAWTESKWEC